MPHPEAVRQPNAQTRGRRVFEIRRENYEEAAAEHRVEILESGVSVASASAVWSDPLHVDGFDRLHMFLKHTAGTATTAVHIAIQCATFKPGVETEWYDCYDDVNFDGTQVPLGYAFDWTTGDLNVCFKMPRFGRYMRFKVWTDGSNRTNSLVALFASRVTESM